MLLGVTRGMAITLSREGPEKGAASPKYPPQLVPLTTRKSVLLVRDRRRH
jgi:hypothetical protein